jgi:HK97 family phage major capsid protein
MSGSNVNASDDLIRRLENELREKSTFANEIISRAQSAERDLTDDDKALISETRGRVEQIKSQLETVESLSKSTFETMNRARQIGDAVQSMRGTSGSAPVEYRSAGEFVLDVYGSHCNRRESTERLEMFYRAHNKTSDATGLIPDPIVGDVINFIDASRPITSALGVRPLPASGVWHRPKVTQHTTVGLQGSAGLAADEKTELSSQKMIITRLDGAAKTYGGYVNVSRQLIDFSTPQAFDAIIEDLASVYAVQTEDAVATAIEAVATGNHSYEEDDQFTVARAVWAAAADVYAAVKNQGQLLLVVAPDRLATFGPLFAPYGPYNQQGTGFAAGTFGQGAMGTISGVPVYMSAGLGAGKAYVLSSSAVEVYEQRVGALQVVEPSILGVQVAYAGYFTPMVIESTAIVPLTASGS